MRYKRKKIFFTLMVLCLLIVVRAYAADKTGPNSKKEKAGNETLVASFFIEKDETDLLGPNWDGPYLCGNNGFIFRGELVSFNEKSIHVITKQPDSSIGCTADGKWVLYTDESSKREYKDIWGTVPGKVIDTPYTWSTSVVDYYRYEVDTGVRQKFAVVNESNGFMLSPDVSKIFLAESPEIMMDMPKPEWDILWPSNDIKFELQDSYWFSDSSRVGMIDFMNNYFIKLRVASAGKDAPVKEYGPVQLNVPLEVQKAGVSLSTIGIDKDDRFYFVMEKPINLDESKYYIFSCEIDGEKLTCESKGSFHNTWSRFYFVGILPNGDFLLNNRDASCIWSYTPGDNRARCIVDKHYGSETYDKVYSGSITPDGKKILFLRSKATEKSNGKGKTYRGDVFIKDISKN